MSVQIEIQNKVTGSVSPAIFGTNLQWEWDGDRILNPDQSYNPDLLGYLQEANVASVRFPGGALANVYNWRDGIGPLVDRPMGLSFAGDSIPNTFGTDELIMLCDELDAKPIITLNINLQVDEIVGWVTYLKQKSPAAFQACLFELGNEMYNPNEAGYDTAQNYAANCNTVAARLKDIDPQIRLGVNLDMVFLQAPWIGGVQPHLVTWNDDVLAVISDEIDFAAIHFYAPLEGTATSDSLYSYGALFEQNLQLVRASIAAAGKSLDVALLEYGVSYANAVAPDPRISGPDTAICMASILMSCIADERVIAANHHSALNNSEFGMVSSQGGIDVRPVYDVFKTLSEQAGNQVLEVDYASPEHTTAATGTMPAQTLESLRVLATRNHEGETFVTMLNLSQETVDVSLPGVGSGDVQSWSASDWVEASSIMSLPGASFTVVKL